MQIKLQAGKLIRNREEHAIEFINIGRSVNDGGIPAVIFGVQLPNGDRVDLNLHADDASVLGQELLGFAELSIKKATRTLEADLIRKALGVTNGNRTNAAKLLEISHRALLYKMKEYGIS